MASMTTQMVNIKAHQIRVDRGLALCVVSGVGELWARTSGKTVASPGVDWEGVSLMGMIITDSTGPMRALRETGAVEHRDD